MRLERRKHTDAGAFPAMPDVMASKDVLDLILPSPSSVTGDNDSIMYEDT